MRTALKVFGFVLAAALLAGMAAAGFFLLRRPAVAPPLDIKVEMTPERIARGKYIFTIADCDGCHSERDFTRFGGPVVDVGRGRGVVFPDTLGLPGRIASPNFTTDKETGIGAWADGEKIRAIREGISRDGRVLFPLMPYQRFRNMSDEDVFSLVAYLNTLPPVRNKVPETRVNFPVSVLIKEAPKPAGRVAPPDRGNRVRYGEYIVALAGCQECHTRMEKGKPVGPEFAGGQMFRFPFATVVSANITPDPQSGIGRWSEQDFLDRFYQYREYVEKGSPVIDPESFTIMSWLFLAQMQPDDLKAVYAFLRTRKPVYNAVDSHPMTLVSQASTR